MAEANQRQSELQAQAQAEAVQQKLRLEQFEENMERNAESLLATASSEAQAAQDATLLLQTMELNAESHLMGMELNAESRLQNVERSAESHGRQAQADAGQRLHSIEEQAMRQIIEERSRMSEEREFMQIKMQEMQVQMANMAEKFAEQHRISTPPVGGSACAPDQQLSTGSAESNPFSMPMPAQPLLPSFSNYRGLYC